MNERPMDKTWHLGANRPLNDNEEAALTFAAKIYDFLLDAHTEDPTKDDPDKVDRDAMRNAVAEYRANGGLVLKPLLCELALATANSAGNWLDEETPENWEKLRKASKALETERLTYFS
jgi:hypothetical protein